MIIPNHLLKEYCLNGEVELRPTKEGILLSPVCKPRIGWEEDAKRLAASEEPSALPDIFADESFDGLEWEEK